MAQTDKFFVKRVKVTVKATGYAYFQWKVEGRINGIRYRKYFSDRHEADGHKAEMEIKALNDEQVVKTTASHLSPDQLRDAEAALRLLGGKHSLTEAVKWFQNTYRDTLTDQTCEAATPLFLADREPHIRPSTSRDYRLTLKAFNAINGPRKVPEVSGADIIAFLNGRNLKGKSWNNTRADLNAFFAWCEKRPRQWISSNPVSEVEKFAVAKGIPAILTAKQVKSIFEFLEDYQGSENSPQVKGFLIPYFALATFAGIRPAVDDGEMFRLSELTDFSQVFDLKNKVIRMTPEIAKTRDVRQVTIQPNLMKWLKAYPPDKIPIIPRNAFGILNEVREQFKIGHDVLRHTFISMHVAKFKSMGGTALQAGNSESMIRKHYLNLVTPADAEAFWKITPTKVASPATALQSVLHTLE